MTNNKVLTVNVPAGDYWIGDPCYTVPGGEWSDWLDATDFEDNDGILCAELGHGTGKFAVGVPTMYGAGGYDQSGRVFGVDSGLIGLVSDEWVQLCGDIHDEEPGIRYQFTSATNFVVSYDQDTGVITIGDVVICTGDDELGGSR